MKKWSILFVLAILGAGAWFITHRSSANAEGNKPPSEVVGHAPLAGSDWPAFHGGGPLIGVAPALPPFEKLKVRWTFTSNEKNPSSIEGGAVIAGGVAFVGDDDGMLHAIELASGKQKWAYKAENSIGSTPIVIDDKVFVGDLGGVFHAVTIVDGKKAWTFDANTSIHASPNAIGKDRLVFGTDGAEVICLSTAEGKELWRKSAGDRVNGCPAIANGLALVSGCDAKLRGMSMTDGAEKFALDMEALSGASPAVADGQIYIGTDGGRVLCIAGDGSKILWKYEEIEENAMAYASPAVSDGIVVVGARDRQVHAIDAKTGKSLWKFKTRGDVDSSPVISGGRIYIGSKDRKFYVLDLKTGAKVTEFQAGRPITAPPAIGEGVIVFGDNAGSVFCLEP